MTTMTERLEELTTLVDRWPGEEESQAWLCYLAQMQLVPELDELARRATAQIRRGRDRPDGWQEFRERCLRLADRLSADEAPFPEDSWQLGQDLLERTLGTKRRFA